MCTAKFSYRVHGRQQQIAQQHRHFNVFIISFVRCFPLNACMYVGCFCFFVADFLVDYEHVPQPQLLASWCWWSWWGYLLWLSGPTPYRGVVPTAGERNDVDAVIAAKGSTQQLQQLLLLCDSCGVRCCERVANRPLHHCSYLRQRLAIFRPRIMNAKNSNGTILLSWRRHRWLDTQKH